MPWVYNPYTGVFGFTNPSGGAPSGAAGGDLSGTYPNPTVANIKGVPLGTVTAGIGTVLTGDLIRWNSVTLSGDATLNSAGVLTIGANRVTDGKLASSYLYADGSRPLSADWAVGSHKLTGLLDPAGLQDAATKNYVDQVAGGLAAREVRLATAAALPANTYVNGVAGIGATITASGFGALTVDGVAVAVGNRLLVKNETAANNGIYVVTATGGGAALFILTRAIDSNDADDFAAVLVFVAAGTANASTAWLCTAGSSIVIGTDPITFTQYQVGQGTTVGGDLSGTVGNATVAKVNGSVPKYAYTWESRVLPQIGVGRRFYTDRAGTIANVYAWATDNAPSTTAATFDVLKNGTSIYSSNPKPSISIGSFVSADTTPNTTAFAKGDKLEIQVTATGGIAIGRLGTQIVFTV